MLYSSPCLVLSFYLYLSISIYLSIYLYISRYLSIYSYLSISIYSPLDSLSLLLRRLPPSAPPFISYCPSSRPSPRTLRPILHTPLTCCIPPPVLCSPPPLSPQVAAKRATVYLLLPEQPPLASDAPPYSTHTSYILHSSPCLVSTSSSFSSGCRQARHRLSPTARAASPRLGHSALFYTHLLHAVPPCLVFTSSSFSSGCRQARHRLSPTARAATPRLGRSALGSHRRAKYRRGAAWRRCEYRREGAWRSRYRRGAAGRVPPR